MSSNFVLNFHFEGSEIMVELMDPIESDQKSCLVNLEKNWRSFFRTGGKPPYHRTPLQPVPKRN